MQKICQLLFFLSETVFCGTDAGAVYPADEYIFTDAIPFSFLCHKDLFIIVICFCDIIRHIQSFYRDSTTFCCDAFYFLVFAALMLAA